MTDAPYANPFVFFRAWMKDAGATELNDPNAMTVATTTADGRPSARILLLKGMDDLGFVFYTNKQSRKAGDIAGNPHVALLFHWKSSRRQVRIEGVTEDVTDAEADAYYASRTRESQLGAWASDQSRPLTAREELERRVAEYDAKFAAEDVPRPPHWSGYRLLPSYFEFWQDMPFRLHERFVFTKTAAGGWAGGRLFP